MLGDNIIWRKGNWRLHNRIVLNRSHGIALDRGDRVAFDWGDGIGLDKSYRILSFLFRSLISFCHVVFLAFLGLRPFKFLGFFLLLLGW